MKIGLRLFCLMSAAVAAPGLVHASDYTLQEVRVHGRVADTVTAISHGGIVGGSFTDKKGDHPGFLLKEGALTVLFPRRSYQGERFEPSSIQDNGLVAGIEDEYGFIWSKGRFQYHDGMWVGWGTPYGGRFLGINQHHVVAFTTYDGDTSSGVGQKAPYQPVPISDLSNIAAINSQGVVSGQTDYYPMIVIFTYYQGKLTLFAGPNGTGAEDGLINDHGTIAGTYGDTGYHGMILRNGKYTTFDAPSPPKDMRAVALSNTDIVVGTYTDASGAYHAYSWHKGVFSEIVKASPTVAVTVTGVSDAGDVTLNLEDLTTSLATPYVAHCHGNDC